MTDERYAQENPAQPAGPYVQYAVDPDPYAGGELEAIEQQKRNDTAQWEDAQNRSPMDNANPAQPPGWGVPPPTNQPIPTTPAVTARVFVDRTASTVVGGKAILALEGQDPLIGDIVANDGDQMGIKWRDSDDRTWENKGDYDLIMRDSEPQESSQEELHYQEED